MDDSVSDFLKKIAMIESSDDYQAKHRQMQGGMHRGMQAVGKYGLMPYTVDDIRSRMAPEVPNLSEHEQIHVPIPLTAAPQPGTLLHRLSAMYQADQLREDPHAQELLANYLAHNLLQGTGGDQERAAYMWTMGYNPKTRMGAEDWEHSIARRAAQVSPEKLDQSDYVQKFRALAQKDQVPQLQEEARYPTKPTPLLPQSEPSPAEPIEQTQTPQPVSKEPTTEVLKRYLYKLMGEE